MRLWFVYPLFLGLLTSCFADEEVIGSGKSVVRELDLSPYTSLVVNTGMGRLYIDQGEKSSLRIEGDDNLVDFFGAELTDNTLTVRYNRVSKITPSKPIKFYATMQKLESLEINGNASVQSHGTLTFDKLDVRIAGSGSAALDVQGKRLDLSILGAGDASINGEVDEQFVKIAGSGSYHGQGLLSKSTTISLIGSGNALLKVKDTLNATIDGAGTIRYKGNPKVEENIGGSGSIIPMD